MFEKTHDPVALKEIARKVRIDLLNALHKAKSGHTGGSLSSVEILVSLYFSHMNHNPSNPTWSDRDRFVLSKGHGVPALYSVLANAGYFPREELPDLVAWLGLQRRQASPKRVTVVRDASHLTSFGWVRIDATDAIASFGDTLTESKDRLVAQRVYAVLEAEVTGPNHIEVRATHVRRYTLFLNRELVDFAKPVTVVTDGRVSFEGMVAPSLETLMRDARIRQDRAMRFSATVTIAVGAVP